MKKPKVSVIEQSRTGLNTKIKIDGKIYSNTQAYNEAKKGNVIGYHGVEGSDGTKFLRSNPDKNKGNNLE